MKSSFRMLAAAAAATLLSVGGASVAHASVPQVTTSPPADCTFTVVSPDDTFTLTCTARPASQQWQLVVTCLPWRSPVERFGTVVTGDGTSTVTCLGIFMSDSFQALN